MSLSNLPRTITQKIIGTNPMQAEREEYERVQMMALQKAINLDEVPAKEKHVRTLIIGTFQEHSAHTFWAFVNSRIPVQGNPVAAWKFAYVLHRLLRDGHQKVVQDSLRYHPFLVDLGRLWGHLKLGHGPLITKYCQLLAVKLDFHRKNPRFPGNLQITNDELTQIADNDVNNYFQVSVEIFDYMDCILDLAATIFGSFDMSRNNSMTASGQCRLIVLIPCILDSCQLYDFLVKMMFRLHTALPQDTLSGHRERFTKQFKLLQHLYYSASNLQYFKNLIQIPSLPERAPNFFSAVDINKHVTPVAKVTEVPEEAAGDGILIDTNSSPGNDKDWQKETEKPSAKGDDYVGEKDRVIDELLGEIDRLRKMADQLRDAGEKIKSDDLIVIEDLRNRVVELERDGEEQRVQTDLEKLTMMRQIEESSKNPQVLANFEELNKRAKVSDEKLKKMREVYNVLSEQHKKLLRDKADADKQYKQTKKTLDDLERQKSELNVRIMSYDVEKEQLQNSVSEAAQKEIDGKATLCRDLENQLAGLQAELDSALMTREKLREEHEALLQTNSENDTLHVQTKKIVEELERQKQESDIRVVNFATEIEDITQKTDRLKSDSDREMKASAQHSQELVNQIAELRAELEGAMVIRDRANEEHGALLAFNAETVEELSRTKSLLDDLAEQKNELTVRIRNLDFEKEQLNHTVAEGHCKLLETTSKCQLLESQLADLDKENEFLKAERTQIQASANETVSGLQLKIEEAIIQCRNTENELADRQSELKDVLLSRENLQAEHQALLRSRAELDEELTRIRFTRDDFERQNNELSVQIVNANTEKEHLQNSSNLTSAELMKEIQETTVQCREFKNGLAACRADLDESLVSREKLQTDYEDLSHSNATTNEQLNLANQTVEDLERQKNDLTVQIASLSTEKEQLQVSSSVTSAELQKEIQEKVLQCETLQTELAGCRAELDSAAVMRERLRGEHEALLLLTTNTEEELKRTKSARDELEREKNNFRNQIGNLTTEKEELLSSASLTSSELQREIQERIAQCHNFAGELAACRSELENTLGAKERLREEQETLTRLNADTTQQFQLTKKALEDLELEKNALSVRIQMLGTEKEQTEKTNSLAATEFRKEIEEKTAHGLKLEKQLSGLQNELETVGMVHKKLNAEHEALVRSNADTLEQLKSAQKSLEGLEREKNELHAKIATISQEKDDLQKKATSTSSELQKEIVDKSAQYRALETQLAGRQAELDSVMVTVGKLHQEHDTALQQHKDLQEKLDNTESDLDSALFQHKLQKKALRQQFLNGICNAAAEQIQYCMHTWEQPAFSVLTSTPEYLLTCVDPVLEHLQKLQAISTADEEQSTILAKEIQMTFSHMINCLIQCMETAHMAPVDLTDEFSFLATKLGEFSLSYLTGFRQDPAAVQPILGQIQESLEVLQHLSNVLIPKVEDVRVDEVADQVEKELHDMDKAIEAAALKIEEMLANTRTRDSGVKLEVNAKILDSCTTLMTAVRVLVRKSRALQQEIVVAGKGFSSSKEFYKRNHRWTEGLISAAKTIGLGANVLLEAADKVVGGKAKFEELVVASQEISAGTVQLVVSSRVKADKNSQALAEMSMASKSVTQATGNVVASAKACAQLVEEKADFDFSGITVTKIKKIEMEAQVKVLELESLLTKEREKLSAIRRQHYSMVGPTEKENGIS